MSYSDKHRPDLQQLTERVREFCALPVDEGIKQTNGVKFVLDEMIEGEIAASPPIESSSKIEKISNYDFLAQAAGFEGAVQTSVKETYQSRPSWNYEKLDRRLQNLMVSLLTVDHASLEDMDKETQRFLVRPLARGPEIFDAIIRGLEEHQQSSGKALDALRKLGKKGYEERPGAKQWQDSDEREADESLNQDSKEIKKRELELGGHSPEEAQEATEGFNPVGKDSDFDSVLAMFSWGRGMTEAYISLFKKIKADYERIVMPALDKGQSASLG